MERTTRASTGSTVLRTRFWWAVMSITMSGACLTDGSTGGDSAALKSTSEEEQECWADTDCRDANPCTKDFCKEGVCVHEPHDAGRTCGDAGLCNKKGECGQVDDPECTCAEDCDDGLQCTRDACVEGGTCEHSPIKVGTSCKGGMCDKNGTCIPECVRGEDCEEDGNPCTRTRCVRGMCKTEPSPRFSPCPAGLCSRRGRCIPFSF